MKILLINPPYRMDCCTDYDKGPYSHTPVPSLGLGYIASFLLERGFKDIKWIECPLEGYSVEDLKKIAEKEKPDFVGITCTTYTYKRTLDVAQLFKEITGATIVLGGPHVSFAYENTLSRPFVDFVVIGEGEHTTYELLLMLQKEKKDFSKINGLVFKKDGKIIVNKRREPIKNLDELPFPARNLLSKETLAKSKPVIITSRGCPFNCIFCSSTAFWGSKVRLRSPENVLEELKELIRDYDIKKIDFFDDTFTVDKERVKKLCRLMNNARIHLEWTCNARVDTVNKEIMQIMKYHGCTEILFGGESGDQKVLDRCRKGITIEKIIQSVREAKEVGLKVILSFVLGLPGENWESVENTIKLINTTKPDTVLINPLIPIIGSDVYEHADVYGIKFIDAEWKDYIQFLVETESMKISDIKKAFFKILSETVLDNDYGNN